MLHPLLLPNVLKNVLSYFSLDELKSFRLVSLDWNHASCILIANGTHVNFSSSEALKSYLNDFKKSNFFPHSAFGFHYKLDKEGFQVIKGFIDSYCLKIRKFSLTLGPGFFDLEQLLFLLRSLKCLEFLGVQFHYFSCPNLEEPNSFIEVSPLPQLKRLEVEVQSYETSWDSATNLLCSIFRAAPNLTTIQHPMFYIPPTKCRIPSQMNIFLTELITIPNSGENELNRLSILFWICKLNNDNIKGLTRKKYPLTKLFTNLWFNEEEDLIVTPSSLRSLMAQLSPSLEELGLDLPWRREVAYEVCFPLPMRNLVYLSLSGYQGLLVHLMEKLPVLQSLELSQIDFFEILPSSQESKPFPSVIKLRLDFCSNQVPGVFGRLSRAFPNLRDLNVNHAADDTCRMIFKKMQGLEKLRLCGDDLTDEGLTGIPSEVAKNNDLARCPLEAGNALRMYGFIGDLRCLKRLKLEAYRLTEASIKHGIVHCASLQFVSMDTRLEKNDPLAVVTRTFRLSEYGRGLKEGEKEPTVIFQEDLEVDEDEDAEKFFQMYEHGFVTDLLYS